MRWKETDREHLVTLQRRAERARERCEAARTRLRARERDKRDRAAITAAWQDWSNAFDAWWEADQAVLRAEGLALPDPLLTRARADVHEPGSARWRRLWDAYDELDRETRI